MAEEQRHPLDRLTLSDVRDRRQFEKKRHIILSRDHYLATDINGDYILSTRPDELFFGHGFPAIQGYNPYSSYIKVDRGDKIHLVGIGIMTEFEGEFWVAKQLVGTDFEVDEFLEEHAEKICLSRALVFEIPKDLLCQWELLPEVEKEEAKTAIIQDSIRRLFYRRKHETEDNYLYDVIEGDKLSEVSTCAFGMLFDNMLADMLEDEAEADAEAEAEAKRNIEAFGNALRIS